MALLFNKWSNQAIRLFHGTTKTKAANVIAQIDPYQGRQYTDFGTGFYTTSWFEQAKTWALILAKTSKESGAVVAFDVDRLQLAALAGVYFVRGSVDADDYWSLVNHCRNGGCHYPESSWYDIVVGPVAASWSGKRIHRGYDQISFHSKVATRILDNCPKEIIDVV